MVSGVDCPHILIPILWTRPWGKFPCDPSSMPDLPFVTSAPFCSISRIKVQTHAESTRQEFDVRRINAKWVCTRFQIVCLIRIDQVLFSRVNDTFTNRSKNCHDF